MKTITIQIGNSDNKLTQEKWSMFVEQVGMLINRDANTVHFFGGSSTWAKWQNVCWVFECKEEKIALLKENLAYCRGLFAQDSVAYCEGETEFV